jgi:hypothetical protein
MLSHGVKCVALIKQAQQQQQQQRSEQDASKNGSWVMIWLAFCLTCDTILTPCQSMILKFVLRRISQFHPETVT